MLLEWLLLEQQSKAHKLRKKEQKELKKLRKQINENLKSKGK